eukprot:scaffold54669_cov58-Phaeocystis_antarctica.AAC.5
MERGCGPTSTARPRPLYVLRLRVGGVTVPVAGVGATCTLSLPLSSLLILGGAGLRCGVRSPMELIAPTTAVVAAMLRKMVE